MIPLESDQSFRCGVSRIDSTYTFILGGNDTKLQEFPFAVLLVKRLQTWFQLHLVGNPVAMEFQVLQEMKARVGPLSKLCFYIKIKKFKPD